ncbi:ATP-binding cassette domain-containing protein, partial [Aerococcus urinae]
MTKLLELDQINKIFNPGSINENHVTKDLSLTIHDHDFISVIGSNGAGKSTLIKHIIGLLKPQSGEIRLNGQSLDEDNRAYRQAFTYIPEMP